VFLWLLLGVKLLAITVRVVALVGKTTLLLFPELLTQLVLANRILLLSVLYQDLLEVAV
jgi:hypothetical protein